MYAAPGYTDPDSYDRLLTAAERYGRAFALLDGPERIDEIEPLTRVATTDPPAPKADQPPGLRPRVSPRGHGAVYVPWLRVPEMFPPSPEARPRMVSVPPSGHVAGLYARNDFQRGVHKAPANMNVRGVTGLSRSIDKADQAVLNPAGVNCFRWFSTEGALLWGARTLASDPQWRYVNVRRLFIMIERSIEANTGYIVFQPNDQRLWRTIRRDISAFLTLLWRQKYLMGATPEQAFFVKCDEETNPPEVTDAGRVETLIGVAPVKPAEFVIFRIGQSQAGATSFEMA
ncbi:phage tail sheath family protein [Dankookia sp. P2]|uniref:phage tail sheath family protein n=1 Tax=Dankookia sp. P2 TaxID=3423955 RepID=UPI003D67358F